VNQVVGVPITPFHGMNNGKESQSLRESGRWCPLFIFASVIAFEAMEPSQSLRESGRWCHGTEECDADNTVKSQSLRESGRWCRKQDMGNETQRPAMSQSLRESGRWCRFERLRPDKKTHRDAKSQSLRESGRWCLQWLARPANRRTRRNPFVNQVVGV